MSVGAARPPSPAALLYPFFSHGFLALLPSTQVAAAGETVVVDAEPSTSTSSSTPHVNGSAVNGAAAKAVNGAAAKPLNGAAAASGGARINGAASLPAANGAAVNLANMDAADVLAIEDGIDACGAGQLEACASDRCVFCVFVFSGA